MQRVVRLSLAGLLTFAGAGLTACGDKVTVPPSASTRQFGSLGYGFAAGRLGGSWRLDPVGGVG